MRDDEGCCNPFLNGKVKYMIVGRRDRVDGLHSVGCSLFRHGGKRTGTLRTRDTEERKTDRTYVKILELSKVCAWVFSTDSDMDRDSDVNSDGDNDGDSCGYDGTCLPDRPPRNFLPLQRQAMRLLSMAVPPEDRARFRERFRAFASGKDMSPYPLVGCTEKVCNTSANWIGAAYGCEFITQLQCTADMFPFSGMELCFLGEIYIMDVILNRSPFVKTEPCAELPTRGAPSSATGVEDDVLLVRTYQEDDLDDGNDFKFRTMILFLPQCGVFYCARERRKENVGVAKTHVALDMSWLRLERGIDNNGKVA